MSMYDTSDGPCQPLPCYFPPRPWRLWLTTEFWLDHSHRPNRWVRFWQRLLLGFRWEPIDPM